MSSVIRIAVEMLYGKNSLVDLRSEARIQQLLSCLQQEVILHLL